MSNNIVYDLKWDDAPDTQAEPADPLYDCGYEPGIYFNLPEEDYHAIPALSNSGIKKLLVSGMDFWADSWMNPNRKEQKQTIFMEMGNAYHTRLLEGKEAFYSKYAPSFDKSKHPEALDTVDQIKDRLRVLKEDNPEIRLGGNKPELVERLLDYDPGAEILDAVQAEYEGQYEGRDFLPLDLIERIEIAAAQIDNHPGLRKFIRGGIPEVTIIWHDPETGIPMKSRMDYLKTAAIVDLKTFSNPHGKTVERAIYSTVANNRYHLQVAVYSEADKHGVQFAKQGKVFGIGSDEHSQKWLTKYALRPEKDFYFLFQQTGPAPVARGYKFPRNLVFDCGVIAMREGMSRFLNNYQTFGTDPWVEMAEIGVFDDNEFPAYMTTDY